uniref:Protein CLP1 homolog n=1 Tax=Minutocellus polymorphus TaxID=265543 RepID=A0A6U0IA75_9STRA|mmetsp:Transcript_10415/g.17214  ORF Transcript_10415/g.17214 Transcript_10415/m.17214 type:complete len:492 (+) Transcript_10415:44-1519(+)
MAFGAATKIPDDAPLPNGQRFCLSPETELRIEVPFNQSATIVLVSGSGEIFGAELATSKEYRFSGTNIAVFTWHGCTVDINDEGSQLDIVYTSDETDANVAFVNTHAQLEALRDEALAATTASLATERERNEEGPRVMVAGSSDCGKSTLVRTLTSYAVKLGRCPMLVDIDPSQNMLSVPGTIGAAPMKAASVDVSSHTSLDYSIACATSPLVYWYGSTDISTNPALYKALLDKLGANIDARMEGDVDAKADGFVLNTSGILEGASYKCLLHAIDALRINIILVIGDDRLYSMLTNHMKRRVAAISSSSSAAVVLPDTKGQLFGPRIIKLPRSGGAVPRNPSFRRSCRSLAIKQYFNGLTKTSDGGNAVSQFTPFLLELKFSDLIIKKLSGLSLTSSMLPVAAKQSTDPVQLHAVDIGPALKHAVLAVCHPHAWEQYERDGNASELYLSGVSGFVAVENVDIDKEILSLLCPSQGDLPTKILLQSDITWME